MRRTSKIEKKIRKKKIGLLFTLLFLLASVFAILFSQTNFFNVSKVEVKNNNILKNDDIIMFSGVRMNENIFTIDTSTIKENLESHPYIKEAKIERKFPNKIVLNIYERNRLLVISSVGSFILLDDEGTILDIGQASSHFDGTFPVVNGLSIKNAFLGDKVIIDNDYNIEEMINFLKLCQVIDLYKDIAQVQIKDNSDIVFDLRSGTKVAFGDLNNVKYKLSFVVNILESLNSREDINTDMLSKGLIDLTQGEDAIFTFQTHEEDK